MEYFNKDNLNKKKKDKKIRNNIENEKFKKVKIDKSYSSYLEKYNNLNKYILFIGILLSVFFCIIYFLNKYKKKITKISIEENKLIECCKLDDSNDNDKYFKIIKDFISINNNNTLIYGNKDFKIIKNPKISVIVSVHNGEGLIRAAVRSIQNQDLNDIEIIIVDDASEDKSIEIIKKLMDEWLNQ